MLRGMNRLLHVAAMASIWLWCAGLCGLWGSVFDTTSPSLWMSAGASLAAFAVGLSVPAQFFRILQTAGRWVRPRGMLMVPPVGMAAGASPGHPSRLLGVSLLLAAVGSLLSAMGLLAAAALMRWLRSGFLLAPSAYLAVQILVQAVVMLGWGVGAAVVWQAQSLTNAPGAGRSLLGRGHEDWLWGLGAAAGIMTVAWRLGWAPLGVALAAGAAQVVCALTLVRWPGASPAVAPASPAAASPLAKRIPLGVAAYAAATALVGTAQLRGLADLLGATLADQVLFGGITVVLVAVLHQRWAGKAAARSGVAAAGAGVLVATALAMQVVLGWLSLAGEAMRWAVYAVLAAQAPLAAGWALLGIAQQRRFLSAGGSARHWAQWVLGGLALGACGGAVVQLGSPGLSTPLLVLLLGLAGAVVVGIDKCQPAGRQAAWALAGAVLLLAITAAVSRAANLVGGGRGASISAGGWLTAWQRDGRCAYLPVPDQMPVWKLDRLAGDIIRRSVRASSPPVSLVLRPARVGPLASGRRWLVVARRPLIDAADGSLLVDVAVADPAVGRLPIWRRQPVRPALNVLRGGPFQYHGAIYAPIRADHPAGRALFNAVSLRAMASRVTRGGMVIVHAPCSGANTAAMLAVARTARAVFGECLLAIHVDRQTAELLIFSRKGAPAGSMDSLVQPLRTQLAGEAVVLPSSRMEGIWADVPLINRAGGTICGSGAFVTREQLADYIERASAAVAFPTPAVK